MDTATGFTLGRIMGYCEKNQMRVGQFLMNVFGDYIEDVNDPIGHYIPDMFHMSDENFVKKVSYYIATHPGV